MIAMLEKYSFNLEVMFRLLTKHLITNIIMAQSSPWCKSVPLNWRIFCCECCQGMLLW